MKKSLIALTALAGILVFALAGCSGSGASSSASSASSSASASSAASSASAESSSAPSEASGSSGLVGMPNPWHTVSSARDAAAGSGISGFVVPEGESISLGAIVPHDYRYMEGLAEAAPEADPIEGGPIVKVKGVRYATVVADGAPLFPEWSEALPPLATLPEGGQVRLGAYNSLWACVRVDGVTGFMRVDMLDLGE